VFIAAALALLIMPGPAVLYIVARSIDQGSRAGLISTLGISVGALFHIGAAALGVSAILAASATAFSMMKYLGAAYLIYLGMRRLMAKDEIQPGVTKLRSLKQVFLQGIWVNVLNPKTALFFFAFLPQFVDASRGQVAGQIVLLGAMFVALGMLSDGLYALLAGRLGHLLKGSLAFLRVQRYLTGGIYIALGLTTALSGSGKK